MIGNGSPDESTFMNRTAVDGMPKKLVILSSVRWDFLWQRHQSLAAAAARDGWDVVFVDPHLRGWKHLLHALLSRARRRPKALSPHVHPGVELRAPSVLVGLVPPKLGIALLSRRLPPRCDVALLYLPSREFVGWVERCAARVVVYDKVVEWAAAPPSFWPPRGWAGAEARVLSRARTSPSWRVTTDNDEVRRGLRSYGVPAATVLPAVDEEFLSAVHTEPRRRAVGFFGAVREEVDVELLSKLADRVETHIIGPVPEPLHALLADSGAILHGPMTLADLVRHVILWRVTLLPYRGDRTATLSPAKLYNCFASGAHVAVRGVTLPDELDGYARVLHHDDRIAIRQIEDLLSREVPPSPITLPDWDSRWKTVKAVGGFS